jgi:hypothetical protein
MNFLFSAGGQFEPVWGGQFEPVYPVQLKSESGGQHNRFLQFNVKEKANRHWLLAIEAYYEENFKPLIRAGRIG